eukprot:Pompholyxophrys_punicea_v1_NODE_415_length_2022_cov_2.241484.p1 type:complete len:188 gc:universal NODE_415_length_2022_cov_2.241484:1106-1669(+)
MVAVFQFLAENFGCGVTTISRIISETCKLICREWGKFINFRCVDERIIIASHFESITSVPQMWGCIDGSQFPLATAPNEFAADYFNRKHYYSVQAQILVDHNSKVRDIYCGMPGSVHDFRQFQHGPFGQWILEDKDITERVERFFAYWSESSGSSSSLRLFRFRVSKSEKTLFQHFRQIKLQTEMER